MATWYETAVQVIKAVQAQAAAEEIADAKEIQRRVDAAYPFGPRSHHPYKAWLKARRDLLGLGGPIAQDRAKLAAWERGEPLSGEHPQ